MHMNATYRPLRGSELFDGGSRPHLPIVLEARHGP